MNYYSKDNRILIFGANSMVGSYLIAHLLQEGYTNIHCVVRSMDRCEIIKQVSQLYSIESVFDKINIIVGECSEYNFVASIIEQSDIVFNTASSVSMGNSDNSIIDTNVSIGFAIAQASQDKGARLVVHVSSIAAIGHNEDGVSTENIVPANILSKGYYAQSKFYSEGEFWKIHYAGTNVVIVNPSVIIGVGRYDGNSSSRLISKFAKGSLFGSNGVTGWVSARDVVRAMEMLSQNHNSFGQRYILNSENIEYTKMINMISGKESVKINLNASVLSVVKLALVIMTKLKIRSSLSAQSINSITQKTFYSNEKVTKMIGINFSPIENTISECVEHYKKYKNEI